MKHTKLLIRAIVAIAVVATLAIPASAYTAADRQITNEKPPIQAFLDEGWIEQASGFWEASRGINYVHIVDENVVWASGYDGAGGGSAVQEFTRTINGGDLWEADTISTAPSTGDSAMIYAIDENTAWVPIHSGNPQGIWKTSDGGSTLARQETAAFSGSGSFPNIVHFWDENVGWCQGDPIDGYYEMYTTTDGGTTWVRVPEANIPAPAGAGEYGVVGYYDVVGDTVWWGTQWNGGNGRVFKSEDRGLNWEVFDTPFPSGCYIDVRMRDATHGLAMDKRSGGSTLAETHDGGETWTMMSPAGSFYGYDIAYVPGTADTWITTGAATGAAGASYSVDGGLNWVAYPEVLDVQLLDCDFIEGGIGWAGSFNQDEFTGGVYKYIPGQSEPALTIENIEGGRGVTATVKNVGTADATNVEYTISIDGGLFVTPKEGTGNLGVLAPGDSATISLSPIGFGLGIITDKPQINFEVTCDEGASDDTFRSARILLFFVLM